VSLLFFKILVLLMERDRSVSLLFFNIKKQYYKLNRSEVLKYTLK